MFNRFLTALGASESSIAVLRIVDKLGKTGPDEVRSLLEDEIGAEASRKVLDFIKAEESFETTLEKMETLAGGPAEDTLRLRSIWLDAREAGIQESVHLDPSITRGLDYYTGVVFETTLRALPDIGSVCSGGRYDELAGLYTKKRLPGVGAAIGLDRLLAALEELGRSKGVQGYTSVLILNIEDELEARLHGIARRLRAEGIGTEVYPERKKLAQQFAYAERKGIAFALISGKAEIDRGLVQIKNLATRESVELPILDAEGKLDAGAVAAFLRGKSAG